MTLLPTSSTASCNPRPLIRAGLTSQVGKGKVTLLEPGDEVIFGAATSSFLNDFRYIFQGPSRAGPRLWGIAESSGGGIHDKYDVREQIGKGSFATVRKGIQRATGNMVAIKIIQKAVSAARGSECGGRS